MEGEMTDSRPFKLGDLVLLAEDSSKQKRTVVGMNFTLGEDGKENVIYKITSREVDMQKKELIEGFCFVGAKEIQHYDEDVE